MTNKQEGSKAKTLVGTMGSAAEFLSADDLWHGFLADPRRGVTQQRHAAVRELLKRAFHRCGAEAVLILGLDGISYAAFRTAAEGFPEVEVAPFLSTVPSTSATAWTTLLTGLAPSEHGVYGAAIYLPALGDSVYLFRPVQFRNGVKSSVELRRCDLLPAELTEPTNWFDDLKAAGLACHALGFPGDLRGNGLVELWLRGASVHELADAYTLYDDPAALAAVVWRQAERLLSSPSVAVFAYLNFDWYLHDHGVTTAMDATLRALVGQMVSYWRRHPRTLVCALSDHGMRAQEPCSFSLLDDPTVRELSASPPGGAGRILYFYPRAETHTALRARIGKLAREEDEILTGEDYLRRFHGEECREPGRVGQLVLLASGPRFPGPMPSAIYEHGGLSRDEMTAFVASLGGYVRPL